MEKTDHAVAIVLDPDCAEGLMELVQDRHVWVVRSEKNDAAVAAVRQGDPTHSLETGVTSFDAAETVQESFLAILGTVEEHHGENSHDPPLSVLEVIGLDPSDVVTDDLESYGFGRIEPSRDGFIAHRV